MQNIYISFDDFGEIKNHSIKDFIEKDFFNPKIFKRFVHFHRKILNFDFYSDFGESIFFDRYEPFNLYLYHLKDKKALPYEFYLQLKFIDYHEENEDYIKFLVLKTQYDLCSQNT